MSHAWRRCGHWSTTAGKGDTCQCTLLAGDGSGVHEGGCLLGFCSKNLRSLSGQAATHLSARMLIGKREFSPVGRWLVPWAQRGRALKSPARNDYQDD